MKQRLSELFELLDARIDDLSDAYGDQSVRDRLVVARECIRDALGKVQHAEEAISRGTAE